MGDLIFSDLDFKERLNEIYIEEKKKIITEQFIKLPKEHKKVIREIYDNWYPQYSHILNESTWLNTIFDIVGIFDPSGIVDAINAVSYFYQGDYFFGLLTMISVIPYVGDLIAKPILGVGKSSKLIKGVDEALVLAKNGKTVEASRILEQAANSNTLIDKFVRAVGSWAPKLKVFVERLPITGIGRKLTTGLRNMIIDWCDLFINFAAKRSSFKQHAANIASQMAKNSANAQKLVTDFNKLLKNDKSLASKFTSFTGQYKNVRVANTKFFSAPWSAGWTTKYFWPGFTTGLLWRNRDLTSLLVRTKWYYGFLAYLYDKLGIDDAISFILPDQLERLLGIQKLNEETLVYANTEEAKSLWDEEFQNVTTDGDTSQSMAAKPSIPKPSELPSSDIQNMMDDPITYILKSILT